MPRLSEIGEFEAIRRLERARREARGVIVDAGDDAAVVRLSAGCDAVLTTDAFIERRHYLTRQMSPAEIGARLGAANLSDLAAMGAAPRWGLLSIGVRPDHDVDALVALERALAGALEALGAGLVGGNLAAVEGREWLSLTLVGEAPRGRAWTRSGARPGDLLAITGSPGRAAAGLALVRALGKEARARRWKGLADAWLAPRPRVTFALALAASEAVTAAIDISDGFAGDVAHLCEASGVGADIDSHAWPADPLLARAARALGVPIDALRFGPSDDYELILAVDPALREPCERAATAHAVPLAFVGRFTDAPGLLTRIGARGQRSGLAPEGFDHFARGPRTVATTRRKTKKPAGRLPARAKSVSSRGRSRPRRAQR